MPTKTIYLVVDADHAGLRYDQFCAKSLADYSRGAIKAWILSGEIKLNGEIAKPKVKLCDGDTIEGEVSFTEHLDDQPEELPLDIRYEDAHMLVIHKPVGLVVHPGAGNHSGTLVNGLLWHYPDIRQVPRAGIVHRLDKDTSGLMLVAKTLASHTRLVEQLQARQIKREYQAIVSAYFPSGGSIDAPIGRHKRDRIKMAIVSDGREAVTHYTVARRFRGFSLLDLSLETGRTHQIRVHMASIHAAIVGDQMYGKAPRFPKGMSESLKSAIRQFPRQALHAKTLSLDHPISGEWLSVTSELPEDMQRLVDDLVLDAEHNTDDVVR